MFEKDHVIFIELRPIFANWLIPLKFRIHSPEMLAARLAQKYPIDLIGSPITILMPFTFIAQKISGT
jgi:hypothetical protein